MNAHCDNLMSRSLAYLELKVGINLAEAVDGRMSRESVKVCGHWEKFLESVRATAGWRRSVLYLNISSYFLIQT